MRARLRLLQISDSAFPTGAFSHSMGLEAFQEGGELRDEGDLGRVVAMHLFSAATSDCVALRGAYGEEALERLVYVDRLLSATRIARELREASSTTGRRFIASVMSLGVGSPALDAFAACVRSGESPGNLALGYGVAAPALGIELEETLCAYLYASAASLVAAGQKLIPLGRSTAQRVLHDLHPEIMRAMEASEGVEVEDMYSFTPRLEIASMFHERQRVRLYIS